MNRQINPQSPDGLFRLIQQVKENYVVLPPNKPKRGKPRFYSGLSFLLLAVVAVALRTFKDSELHRLLECDSGLRSELGFQRLPHRTTIGRRLSSLLDEAEAQVNSLGQFIVKEVQPPLACSKVSAIDGRMYKAVGPRWHKRDREASRVPIELRNVDCESAWFKSGYRGWVQGYRLMLQGLVFPSPVPIWATWRRNDEGEPSIAATAIKERRLQVTEVLLGDASFGGPKLVQGYATAGGFLLTPKQLPKHRRSWRDDLYSYRKETIELLFQRVIQSCDLKACPVKGLNRNGAFVIVSVWLYQIIFLSNYRRGKSVAQIKNALDYARWRLAA
jgi:hypothetical protein